MAKIKLLGRLAIAAVLLILLGSLLVVGLCRVQLATSTAVPFFGGRSAAAILRAPDQVRIFPTVGYLWELTNSTGPMPKHYSQPAGSGKLVSASEARSIADLLLNPATYDPPAGHAAPVMPEIVLISPGVGEIWSLFS